MRTKGTFLMRFTCRSWFVLGISLWGVCVWGTATKEATERDTHELLDAVLWMQTSAEYQVLTKTVYTSAKSALDAALADPTSTAVLEQTGDCSKLPPCVIMDIDETVLDNSRFEGQLVHDGGTYDPKLWGAWVREAAAAPVPGAVDYIKYAQTKGVTVFLVTNREASEESDTLKNLAAVGIKLSKTTDTLLCKKEKPTWGSDKTTRRSYIASSYRIVQLFGDDLGDFVSGAQASPDARCKLACQFTSFWGSKWFLLPNPLYGSWESSLYGGNRSLSDEQVLERKKALVRGFE